MIVLKSHSAECGIGGIELTIALYFVDRVAYLVLATALRTRVFVRRTV
jgi:hypothetical protein